MIVSVTEHQQVENGRTNNSVTMATLYGLILAAKALCLLLDNSLKP